MGRPLFDSEEFQNVNYGDRKFPAGDYEDCTFTGCSFTSSDLSASNFGECKFVQCDLSNANLTGITLRDVSFESCKLLGLKFESCNELLFSVGFEQCQLDFSSFYKHPLIKTRFYGCKLLEVDFTEADLSEAEFLDCDLSGVVFLQTNLEQCDFRTAVHYHIDPELNRMKKAKFSLEGLGGLLTKYDLNLG